MSAFFEAKIPRNRMISCTKRPFPSICDRCLLECFVLMVYQCSVYCLQIFCSVCTVNVACVAARVLDVTGWPHSWKTWKVAEFYIGPGKVGKISKMSSKLWFPVVCYCSCDSHKINNLSTVKYS